MTGHDIVCIAEADFDNTSWLNVQPMMTRLAKKGNRILYIESLGLRVPKLSHAVDIRKIKHRLFRLFEGIKERRKNLWVMAPLVLPAHHISFIRRMNRFFLKIQLWLAMRRLNMNKPILWIYLPSGLPLVGELGEKLLVYHCVDDYLANPGVPKQEIKQLEDQLASRADAIIVTAPSLAEKFSNKPVACIPNGADLDSYRMTDRPEEPKDLQSIPHPRIGFAGNLTNYKVDFDLLERVISKNVDWHFVFIGPVGGGSPSTPVPSFLQKPNVHHLGEKPYAQIPFYLSHWDVGLIPYRDTASTRAVFPIKFFEYLAAGLPVVTTPLPSLKPYADFCEIAQGPDPFSQAIKSALSNSRSSASDRKALAEKNSWDARVEETSAFLAPFLANTQRCRILDKKLYAYYQTVASKNLQSVTEQWGSLTTCSQYRLPYALTRRYAKACITCLDWGCGSGHYSHFLLHEHFPTHAYAFETPPAFLLEQPSFQFTKGDRSDPVTLPFPSASFETIFSVGVLEHVHETGGDQKKSLREIERILKPGGYFLIFHLPNKYSWIEMLVRLLNREHAPKRHAHSKLFTHESFSGLLKDMNFSIVEKGRYNFIPRNSFNRLPKAITDNYWISQMIDALDTSLSAIFPIFCQNWFYILRKS